MSSEPPPPPGKSMASRLPSIFYSFVNKPPDTPIVEVTETSPLLSNRDVNDKNDEAQASWTSRAFGELWLLTKMTVPVVLAYLLQNSLQTCSVLIVGRLGSHELAVAAFSYMFAMATGWLIALGGTTALDTLGSSSFTGSSNPHELGILLQRAFIVLGALYIPVCVLWWFAEPLFIHLHQDAEISASSATFLRYLIPGGLGYIYFEALKKYLQAQGLMKAGTYVLFITAPLSALLNWLLVHKAGMGLAGAPVATGIVYWLNFLLLLGYTRFVAGWQAWGGWDRAAFTNVGVFVRLAVMGVIMVGTEWWAFEIVALAAGKLGTLPLAAQSVIMTADQVMNTITFGISVAASNRVANRLGARDAAGARWAAHTAAWMSILVGLVVLTALMCTRNVFALMFNDDPDVVELVADVLPYVALFQVADGLVGSCGGSLRGMGRQHIGALVNSASYYCGALPLGIYLAFHGWGLEGLWFGQCIALYLVGVGEWVIVAMSNWTNEVRKAFERMDEGDRIESGPLLPDNDN